MTALVDALRYEVVRLRTIRSTYWLIGLALSFQALMSMLIAWRLSVSTAPATGDSSFEIVATIGASTGVAPLFIAYVLGLLGVFSMGHEYRHGMVRATLTAMPRRGVVFVAKVLTTAATAAVGALGCIVVALVSMLVFGLELPSATGLREMTLGTTIFTALFALSGFGFAAVLRNQTAAVAFLLLVPSVIEAIIRAIVVAIKLVSDDPRGRTGFVEILRFLPYDAGGQMYTRLSLDDLLEVFGVVPFGALGGGLVMGSFVTILLGLGAWSFLRRDA